MLACFSFKAVLNARKLGFRKNIKKLYGIFGYSPKNNSTTFDKNQTLINTKKSFLSIKKFRNKIKLGSDKDEHLRLHISEDTPKDRKLSFFSQD